MATFTLRPEFPLISSRPLKNLSLKHGNLKLD